MSLYNTVYIHKRQLDKEEIEQVNQAIENADWNWEAKFVESCDFWKSSFRNIARGRGGGFDGLADLIKEVVDFKPYVPTKLQLFTFNMNEMGQKPELECKEYSW